MAVSSRLIRADDALLGLIEKRQPDLAPRRSVRERLLARSAAAAVGGGGYAEAALARELEALAGAQKGQRNHALNQASFSAFQLVGAGLLDLGEAADQLRATARSIGLGDEEIERTLASAADGAERFPRSGSRLPSERFAMPSAPAVPHHPPTADVDPETGELGVDDGGIPTFARKLDEKTYTWAEVLALPDPEPLIERALMQDSLACIYGPPASKKSFLALSFALSIATGSWWHGHRVEKGGVLYFAGEGAPGLKARIQAWLMAERLTHLPDDFRLVGRSFNLLSGDEAPFGVAHVDKYQPRLVVIDTLARHTAGADENSSKDWSYAIDTIDRMREVSGACVLVVHHTNADATKMRGHTSLLGALDTSIEVKSAGAVSELHWRKMKDSAAPATVKLWAEEHGPSIVLRPRPDGARDDVVDEATCRKILAELHWVAAVGMKMDDICSACQLDRNTVGRAVTKMLGDGTVKRSGYNFFPAVTGPWNKSG